MTHRYLIEIFWSNEDQSYIAVVPDLPGCCAYGDTPMEAMQEMEDAIEAWLEACRNMGRPIPEPKAQLQKVA